MEQNKDQSGAAVRGEAVAVTDDQIKMFWLNRDCMDAILDGDILAQFVSAFRAGMKSLGVSARAADAPSEPSEPETKRIERQNMQGMADCMDMVRNDLIEMGIIDNSVAPMFIPEAVANYVKSRAADALDSQPTDATRYQRLRVLGAAPCGSKQLDAGNVLRFQGLDAFIDADLAAHPSRGEASSQPTVRSSAPDGWISVKDGLPELGQTVLAVNSEYGQRESKFDRWPKGSINRSNYGEEAGYFKWQEPMNNWGSSWEPTHWRQLLTAPASSQPTDGGVRNG